MRKLGELNEKMFDIVLVLTSVPSLVLIRIFPDFGFSIME
jgi:hypothetical protein